MIQVFRKNWFVFTLLLLPYAILTRIWMFFGTPEWPVDTQSQGMAFRYFEQFFPAEFLWNAILATVLVFINAVQINYMVIKNRISREINLFSGMAFILLTALHKDMFWLSPQLISVSFLLASIQNIFRIYHKPRASRYFFNAGFFLGLSVVFYPPYIFFLAMLIVSILVLRKMNVRDFIQLLSGLLLVFLFSSFFRFWHGQDFMIFGELKGRFEIRVVMSGLKVNEWIILLFILTMGTVAAINYRKFTIKKSIQSQKKVNMMYWNLVISVVCILFSMNEFFFTSLIIIMVSLSVFSGMLMSRSKNEVAMELIHFFMLFFVIFSHFWF